MGFDLVSHLQRQNAWSERTFGPGDRTEGVVDHITKELQEVLSAPDDLSEWMDIAILALDGAWRKGFTPEQICEALTAKLTKNEGRKWPDWRTAEPGKAIEHIREGEDPKPAPGEEYFIVYTGDHWGEDVLFWRPNSMGYTEFLTQAGRYAKKEAEKICKIRGKEHMLPCSEAWAKADATLSKNSFSSLL